MPRKKKQFNWIIAVFLIGIMIGIVTIGGVFFWWRSVTSPITNQPVEPISFVVETGQSSDSIASSLEEKNLIKSTLAFSLMVRRLDLGSKLQAGNFSLSPSDSLEDIVKKLTKAKADEVSVTLLEGWRREQMAAELAKVLTAEGIDFSAETFLTLPETNEGRIFPDTYSFSYATNEQTVAKTIEANFNRKIASIQDSIDASPYSLDQILTMASIVEREARTDRRIVAGILWKRLGNDWPLQADATLQYAKGYNALTQEWWTPPLAIDKEIDSPYNSYANLGLPPGPIASPSLDAIVAAANPTETEYWFYITAPDGSMHYAQDYDGHLVNVNRYLR